MYGDTNSIGAVLSPNPVQNPKAIPPKKSKKFSPEDDALLIQIVSQSKTPDWKQIALSFQNKTPRMVRERWKFFLSPDTDRTPFTREQDERLLKKVAHHGTRWTKMIPCFPGKSPLSLSNRYRSLVKHDCAYLGKKVLKGMKRHPDETRIMLENDLLYQQKAIDDIAAKIATDEANGVQTPVPLFINLDSVPLSQYWNLGDLQHLHNGEIDKIERSTNYEQRQNKHFELNASLRAFEK